MVDTNQVDKLGAVSLPYPFVTHTHPHGETNIRLQTISESQPMSLI